MRRDLQALAAGRFDVLVVGGGIYGATIAREAALRGLAVALVERGDFGAATSANSQKTIHGGLRYLQHLDLARVRESIRERRAWLHIAPEWVRPMPVVIPTYGHGLRGREILALGRWVHRAAGVAAGHPPPAASGVLPEGTLSRAEVLARFPGIAARGLTGGFVFHDAQVANTERLLWALLRSAAGAGATLANYAAATAIERDAAGGLRVAIEDRLAANGFTLRAAAVVDACGPWSDAFLQRVLGDRAPPATPLARGFNLVTRRLFDTAVGLYGSTAHRDPDALFQRGGRLLFLVPWGERTILGTEFHAHPGAPQARPTLDADAVERFVAEVASACPTLGLRPADVTLAHVGYVPMSGVGARGDVRLLKHYRLRELAVGGAPGLFSVIGVKYTTARDVAERTIDRVARFLGRALPPSRSAAVPLPSDPAVDLDTAVRRAFRDEMAVTLEDVVRRRTDLGAAGPPSPASLARVAAVAAAECGWSAERTASEVAAVDASYRESLPLTRPLAGLSPKGEADPSPLPVGERSPRSGG